MNRNLTDFTLIFALGLGLMLIPACKTTSSASSSDRPATATVDRTDNLDTDNASPTPVRKSPAAPQATPQSRESEPALVLLDGRPLDFTDMRQALLEAAGGTVLSELVLDYALAKQLRQRGFELSSTEVNAEKELMLEQLDPEDENKATLLLEELRERKGWGEVRFMLLLRRNAGLRKLVEAQSIVTEVMVRTEYQIRYGKRYEVRMIMHDNLNTLQALRPQLKKDGDFSRLAAKISMHASASRGGLLPAFSAADPGVPNIIRESVASLSPGDISDPLSMDTGFAILKLERVLPARKMAYDQVAPQLAEEIKLKLQATLMRQKARELVESVDVLPMDPVLLEAWEQQKAGLLKESR